MRLYTLHRRQLYAFALALAPNAADAEDVLQDTSTRMWQKFEEFNPDTNFSAWARAFIRYTVLDSNRKRRRSDRRVRFDDRLVEAIADRLVAPTAEPSLHERALQECLERLPGHSRELVRMRYTVGGSLRDVAIQLGRPAQSVSKSLSRIRLVLAECVKQAFADGRYA